MVILDSNIIVYSINTDSVKSRDAQKFIDSNKDNLCIAHQNILESIRVLTHPKFVTPMDPQKASDAVWQISNKLTLISPSNNAILLFRELVNKYKFKDDRIFDAYLVATALVNDISVIATDNVKDFNKISEISVINPFLIK